MYVRKVLSGTFQVVNKHMIKDLEELGIWDEKASKINALNDGKINSISSDLNEIQKLIVESFLEKIPPHIKEKYIVVWEMSMRDIIDMAADRGAFIDQSQSMNLFVANPDISKLTAMHFYAWSKGLKTGMYYLRQKPAMSADKSLAFNVDEYLDDELPSRPLESDFECFNCGA